MIQRPRFRSHLHVEVVQPNLVFLLHERGQTVLESRLFALLAPCINGRNTFSDIVDLLDPGGEANAADVFYGLSELEERGHILESTGPEPTRLDQFLDAVQDVSRLQAQETAPTLPTVSVRSLGSTDPKDLLPLLESVGIRTDSTAGLSVVLTEDYLDPRLETVNSEALCSGRPWMPVKAVGTVLWIGPTFHPGKTGCWTCLAVRLREHRFLHQLIAERNSRTLPLPVPLPTVRSTLQCGLGLAATWIRQQLLPGRHEPANPLVTLDLQTLTAEKHYLVRLPRCPGCGEPQVPQTDGRCRPVILQEQHRIQSCQGGHRVMSAEKTWDRLRQHVSPITGIVGRLQPHHQDRDHLIHVYVAGEISSRDYERWNFRRKGLRNRSWGKGMTALQAKVSALGEALERYSGTFQEGDISKTGSYRELGGSAIHPNECMLFSEAQYQHRAEWNAREGHHNWIPKPFDEHREIAWTSAWSLSEERSKYLPTAYCYYGYSTLQEDSFCRADSNGCAAGNTLEEAILQGLLELVERDSAAIWWYNELRKPEVDLGSFDQPYFQSLAGYYRRLERTLWVLDITADLEIPTFVAVSFSLEDPSAVPILGFGTHFSPEIAVSRALTEMNQFLPASTVELTPDKTSRAHLKQNVEKAWLWPNQIAGKRTVSSYADRSRLDLTEEIRTCLDTLHAGGMELLVLDQTRKETDLRVVKVIVPGLRPWWARFARGRLFEVPAALGWLEIPRKEEDLNPSHLFL